MQIFFVVNDHMTANSVNVILLLEIFTKTYTNIYKYWNYLLVFSFVHNQFYIATFVFCILTGCACQLVIKENDDDDDDDDDDEVSIIIVKFVIIIIIIIIAISRYFVNSISYPYTGSIEIERVISKHHQQDEAVCYYGYDSEMRGVVVKFISQWKVT